MTSGESGVAIVQLSGPRLDALNLLIDVYVVVVEAVVDCEGGVLELGVVYVLAGAEREANICIAKGLGEHLD